MVEATDKASNETQFYDSELEKIVRTILIMDQLPESIFIIRGVEGAGKTSLLRSLINASQGSSVKTGLLSLASDANPDDLYAQTYLNFCQQELSSDIDVNEFLQMLEDAIPQDESWLLMVDDAHLYSQALFESLIKLIIVTNNKIKLCISVDETINLKESLGHIWGVIENRCAEYRLDSYDEHRAGHFIEHLTKSTGLSGDLNAEKIRAIINSSEGNPGKIKARFMASVSEGQLDASVDASSQGEALYDGQRSDESLSDQSMDEEAFNEAAISDEAFNEEIETKPKRLSRREQRAVQQQEDEELNSSVEVDFAAEPDEESETKKAHWLSYIPIFHLVFAVFIAGALYTLINLDEGEPEPEEPAEEWLADFEEVNTKTADKGEMTTEEQVQGVDSADVATDAAAEFEEEVLFDDDLEPSVVAAKPAPVAELKSKPKASPKVKIKESQAKVVKASAPVDWYPYQDGSWISAQSSAYYTLQLMASHDANGIKSFLKENGVSSSYAVYSTKKDGKDWHVVIYGIYENHDFADQARKNLPDYLQQLNPWIRSMKDVQKSIR